jgi:uncharacterized RDD family membrane protein YckC
MVSALELVRDDSDLQNHWLKRFIAIIIDAVLIWITIWVLNALLTASFFALNRGIWLEASIISGLIWIVYSTVMEGTFGHTFGKKFLNLQVRSLYGDMDLIKAFIRNISKIHWLFLLLDWLVGFATDGDPRQRLLDRFANTIVVSTDRRENFPGAHSLPPDRATGVGIPIGPVQRGRHPPPRRRY